VFACPVRGVPSGTAQRPAGVGMPLRSTAGCGKGFGTGQTRNQKMLEMLHLVFLFLRQPSAYIWLMVIMEMVKEFTSGEALIVYPYKVVRWFDSFDPDSIG
jgi:hypothetical protein